MQDVTHLLNAYRECARGVWNNFLRQGADFERIDAFSVICERLFQELVLREIGKRHEKKSAPSDPYPFLLILPIADQAPIMVSRPSQDGNKYWDDPVARVSRQGVRLLFIDYFDWDQMGIVDFQYYRVRVASFDDHPKLVGREALLDVHDAKAFFHAGEAPSK